MGQAAVLQEADENSAKGRVIKTGNFYRTWLLTANDLLAGARVLYRQYLQENLLHSTPDADGSNLLPVITMLIGMSFECMLKSLYVIKVGDLIDSNGYLIKDKDLNSHDLMELAALVGFDGMMTEDEKKMMKAVGDAIYQGRYPVPARWRRNIIEENGLVSTEGRPWLPNYFLDVEHVLEKLTGEISQMKGSFIGNFSIGIVSGGPSFVDLLMSMPKDDGEF